MKYKIKIIYLMNYTMTESKWFRQEMNYFKENSDFEIHELSDFLFPSMKKLSGDAYEKKKILTFKTFLNWKNHVLNLRQKCIKEEKKLVVLTELSCYPRLGYNLKYLMVNKFLKQCEIDYYEINNHGASSSKANTKTYLKFIKIFKYWRYLLIRLNEIQTSFFGILLGLKPKGIFVAGSQIKKKSENLTKTKSILCYFFFKQIYIFSG